MSADQASTGQDPLRLTIEEVGAANRRAQIDGESSLVDSAPHLGIESLDGHPVILEARWRSAIAARDLTQLSYVIQALPPEHALGSSAASSRRECFDSRGTLGKLLLAAARFGRRCTIR